VQFWATRLSQISPGRARLSQFDTTVRTQFFILPFRARNPNR